MLRAFCWRNGVIGFTTTLEQAAVPDGALEIENPGMSEDCFRELIEARARLAHDNRTLLVPGVPEAETDKQALDAFDEWVGWIFSSADEGIA
ncbi:host nuclease inhibitor protein [Aliiroseovarius crassostreae]|uniref:host nuclease inhibitor protein n=1 Tax=Aliiroseovarius crassostreae TaxID=154981 RepID=UPI002208AF5D|nr:host nuclease inhibitor protein [Aliiroseovarius crassostreae]UWQ00832.1 host nuclease inhibitor protein [Aliiroseovarius crassostreae]